MNKIDILRNTIETTVNGSKVIRATSLVIHIAKKKSSIINTGRKLESSTTLRVYPKQGKKTFLVF